MDLSRHEIAFYYPVGHQAHYEHGHPERPERVERIKDALQEGGWWDNYPRLESREIPGDILYAVHDRKYVETLQAASRRGQRLDMDTYTTPASWGLALNASGGALSIAEAVWTREANRGFALTRPPGHHATANRGMGFCLLNNVAIAAEYLLQARGAQRLAVIDLDLHHGNGTQDIFWRRGDVFYISTHQYPYYPGTGNVHEVGEGPGEGSTANFPLPPGSGDKAFAEIMGEFILPLLDRYCPEMLLVSFGFDTHWRDPLGHLQLSAAGYGSLIGQLSSWVDDHCNGRIALFLEGGYDLDAAAACAGAVVSALLGEEWQDPLGPSPRVEGSSWQVMTRQAREIWML
jgi:acetoin utilization deacetylase AcuC-like enzyme